MQREWPQRQAQTKAALKRERLLREKILEDVSKKVNQTKRVLRPALESATLSNATAQQAKHTANALSKVSMGVEGGHRCVCVLCVCACVSYVSNSPCGLSNEIPFT